MANWAKIKVQYLAGESPKQLSIEHKIKAQSISQMAHDENWKAERGKFQEQIARNYVAQIEELVNLSLPVLKEIITSSQSELNKINAIKAVLDISGLKKETLDNNHRIDKLPQELINWIE